MSKQDVSLKPLTLIDRIVNTCKINARIIYNVVILFMNKLDIFRF